VATLLGLLLVLLGVALAAEPWVLGHEGESLASTLVTGVGLAVIVLGLALSHRAIDVWRAHRSRH
jgi:hypothetical protein